MSHRIPSSLNIISWNVASWSTTAGYIAKYHGSVSNWLDRHHIDILCLQEVKATRQKILATPVCHLNPSHWDMFLSPSVSRPGLNGVATLVRRNRVRPSGTGPSIPTLGADPRPFGVADLDDQGRCILTDHGAFTLINVYVPYDGEKGVQVSLKLRFFENLRLLVKKIQASGRCVICVGDFNVARVPRDVHYEFRKLNLAKLAREDFDAAIATCESKLPHPISTEVLSLVNFLRSRFDEIQSVLADRKIVEIASNNNGSKYTLKLSNGSKTVPIGQRQTSPNGCDCIANLDPILTQDGYVYKEAGIISIGDLFEVLSKLFSADFPDQTKMAFSDLFGIPRSCQPVIEKYDQLLSECNLIDTYTRLNPAGRQVSSERFTCWDQYRNERYENKGARIDYIFVDRKFEDAIRLSETCLDLGPFSVSSDRSCALRACTADQLWRPVPFVGGGIDAEPPTMSAKNFEFQFTNPPQTGIVYTAPLFSDHVATSLVLDMAALPVVATTGIEERAGDVLGLGWKASMGDAIVSIGSKSHSLKDMFSKLQAKKPEVIEIEDSAPSSPDKRVAVKKSRLGDSGNS